MNHLTFRWSKTDQAADGVEIGIPKGRRPATCPIALLRAWHNYAKIGSGPIFRPVRQNGKTPNRRLSDASVSLIVKRHVGHARFAAAEFSGHSLRAGLATSAAEAGQNEREIMSQTRHKSEKMVRRYIRKGSLFLGNVVGELGILIDQALPATGAWQRFGTEWAISSVAMKSRTQTPRQTHTGACFACSKDIAPRLDI